MEFTKPRGASFNGVPRRVFTAPIQSTAPPSASSSRTDNGVVDTLYDHPNVKIVSFTAGSHLLAIGPQTEIKPGSLAWSNQLERTIAAGAFRIYRAPGSVAFLSCGAALQPILPKSQAWCVDEESSKFVLQIRRPQYWRIEIPVEEEQDRKRAQVLREVLDKILQFEKTECPFQRSFTVELPERPQTPVKKKPWTPVRRSSACLPVRPVTPVEIAHVHRGPPRGSICMGDLRSRTDTYAIVEDESSEASPHGRVKGGTKHDSSPAARPTEPALRPKPIKIGKTEEGGPATPIEPALTVMTPSTSQCQTENSSNAPTRDSRQSPSGSLSSFENPDSWRSTPLPPSPPLSKPGSPVISIGPENDAPKTPKARNGSHPRATSQVWRATFTGSAEEAEDSSVTRQHSVQEFEQSPKSTRVASPYLNVPEEAIEDEAEHGLLAGSGLSYSSTTASPSSLVARRPMIRRATTSSSISPDRRALSPLPSAADLFTRRRSQLQVTTKHDTSPVASLSRLPLTMIHKTCEILMSPPSHLINLMLKVSARIAAGEWRGLVLGTGEDGERIPVQWDYTDHQDQFRSLSSQNSQTPGRRTGWTRAYDDDNDDDGDWWLKKRNPKDKMAGTFPESDDEDGVDPLDTTSTKYRGGSVGKNAEWGNVD